MRWCLLLYAMTACMRVESTPGTGTEHTITLTIDRRATVRDTSSLLISISSAGTTTTDTVAASEFPLFHTVTADGLIGRVDISVDALNDTGTLVGRGETTTDANAGRAAVMVQGADFLLNSSYTGDQLLTNDFDAAGVQLAATSDAWTVAFRDECTSCGIYARRFDASGFPLASGGSTAQLTMSSVPTRPDANPAVAAGATDTLVVWDFTDLSTPDTQGVACRPLDARSSEPGPGQQTIASEMADVVTAIALASGNFVVTWNGFMTTSTIRSMIVRPDCSAVTSPTTISSPVGVKGPYRAHAATNAAALLYTWIVDGDLHLRAGHDDGTFTSSERVLVYHGAADEIEQARITPWRDDFAVAARWSATFSGGSGPRLELYRVSTEGQMLAAPISIAEMSRSDTAADRAFGIARRADGLILIVWHSCPTGPGSCNVLGRFVGDGVATTDEPFMIPTTVTGDQTDPSVTVVGDAFIVAWTDASASAPDTSGAAVRARILIPAP